MEKGIEGLSNDNNEIKVDKEASLTTFRFMSSFILGAMKEFKLGQRKAYNELVNEFDTTRGQLDMRKVGLWLQVLNNHISVLDVQCDALFDKILTLDWLNQSQEFIELFTRLVKNIITWQGAFITPALKMVAKLFLKPSSTYEINPTLAQSRIHQLLSELLTLIPTAPNTLLGIIVTIFPRKRQPAKVHEEFYRNLIRVLSYTPSLRNSFLELMIEHALKIDVMIQVELEELEDRNKDKLNEDIFEMDMENNTSKDLLLELEDDSDEEEEVIPEKTNINQMVEKLDGMLSVLFDYLSEIDYTTYYSETLYRTLLTSFDNVIIKTFKSRYTQFLIFYICSKNQIFTDNFLYNLYITLKSTEVHQVTRIAAAAYLGSFISRAKFLTEVYVIEAYNSLLHWLVEYVNEFSNGGTLDPHRHAVFYSATQAALYIFCFRWRTFRTSQEGTPDTWHTSVTVLRHIVNSNLNPLKVCSEVVVDQFANLSHQLNFMYCYPLIEANRKLYLPLNMQGSIDQEAFFPFDPYRLESSRHHIDPIYQEWEGIDQPEDVDLNDNKNNEGNNNNNNNNIPNSLPSPLALAPISTPLPTASISTASPLAIRRITQQPKGFSNKNKELSTDAFEDEDEEELIPTMMAMSLSPAIKPFKMNSTSFNLENSPLSPKPRK